MEVAEDRYSFLPIMDVYKLIKYRKENLKDFFREFTEKKGN